MSGDLRENQSEAAVVSDWTRWSACWERERPENHVESVSGGSGAREGGKVEYRPRRAEEVTPQAALASARSFPTFPLSGP